MSKLAIDIGGTWLRSELIAERKEPVQEKRSSHSVSLEAYVESMLQTHTDISEVAISFAGQVDDGTIVSAPNIAVKEYNIKKYIESKYPVTLKIDNDLNCALLAERTRTKTAFIALLSIGTGMGSAVLEKGSIVRGAHNLSWEIGHVPFRDAPFQCGCGKHNCLELFCSGSGLEKWYTYYGIPSMTLEALRSAKTSEAMQIYTAFKEALLHAAASLITLANPEELVLGGGIVQANSWLESEVKEEIGDYALASNLAQLTIRKSTIQNASLEGAKLL